jgi:hypothetical protein
VSDTLHITGRDHEIAQALVQKVRLFSQRQIAEHWWNGELANTRRRLKRLAQRNLIFRMTVQARPIPSMDSPLATWRLGDPMPDVGQIIQRCKQRWRYRPTRPCSVWLATEKCSQFFGGVHRGGLQHVLQATHDLGVAAVWLRFHTAAPQWAAAWRSEDLLAHTRIGEKLPDAFIIDHTGQVQWVLEFATDNYDAQRIREFHNDCAARHLPYQIW